MTGRQKQASKPTKIVPITKEICDEISNDSDSLDGKLRVDTSEEGEQSNQSVDLTDISKGKNQNGSSTGLAKAIIEHLEVEDSDDNDNDDWLIDKSVEKNIRSVAIKNNLDHNSVRRIIRKLVKNDHVLALVKIKEEEMIKLEKNNGSSINSVLTSSKNIPITRLRAKELNPNPTPIKQQQITSETAMLIHQELNSDDEDDEYQPCEEDMHSDDNTTISDIDSQPRTPATPFQSHDNSGYLSPAYSKDGVFKVPKSLDGNENRISNEEQEIIAQRTRSKVCLQATPIEEIESTFIPPDITLDMYDFDWEIDNVYKEFLTDMQKPMQHHIENDDDENDPEYVAADKEPIDREEHKMSRVSKKEVNDLLKEVWDMIGSIDFDETLLENVTNELINEDKSHDLETPEILLKGKPSPRPKKIQSQTASLNSSIVLEPEENRDEVLTYTQLENVKISSKSETIFNPNIMSTPSREEYAIETTQNLTVAQTDSEPATNTNNVNVIEPSALTTITENTFSPTLYIPQTTTYFISDNNLYQINGVTCQNGVLQLSSEQFPTILPTFQLTTTSETISSEVSQFVKIENISKCSSQISTPNAPMVVIPSNLTDDVKTQQMSRAFCAMEKRYAYLNDSNYELKFDANHIGFTDFQRQLLNQQLRQHVQILTTNFAQTYGHPALFKYADRFLEMLKEIDKKYEEQEYNKNSAWNIWNLKPSIFFCESWMKTLSVDSRNNKKYLEFLNKELEGAIEYRKKRMSRPIKLARKLTNWIIESYAIVYPKLLPKCGYNVVGMSAKNPFVPSEDFIFAYGLENCYDQIHKDLDAGKIKKPPGLYVICNSIAATFNCKFRTGDSIFQYVKARKAKACPMNPIKYYFEYGKWPPMKYNLEPFDQNTIKPLKDMERHEIGNEAWEKIVFSKSRLGKLHNKRLIKNGLPPEYIVSDTEDSDVELLRNTKKKQTPQSNPRIKIIYKTVSGKEIQAHTINYNVQVNSREPQQCSKLNSTVVSRISCLCSSADDCSSIGEVSTINESSVDPNQRLLSEFFPKIVPIAQRKTSDYELFTKFRDIIEKFHDDYDKYKINICNNELLLNIYNSIKTLDVYTQLLVDIKMNPNFQINLDNFTNITDQPQASSSITPIATGNQKPIHQINSKVLSDEREFNYAQNFYDKVRETFLIENNSKDFEAFQSYLLNFDHEKHTVPELYYKMEKLFYPRHQALAELFLTFLLPGHAAQVGKFYENFMLTNMTTFINKLNTYYSRQPSQIRKIYSCLNDLMNEKELSMEKIKQKILPLLKGNQILTDWFLQLFPSEPSPETPETEYETIHVAKHQNDEGKDDNLDDYETIPPSEIVQDNEIQGCGIKYIQGRIYYGNRVLLPAKLSFLAYDVLPLKGTTPGKSIPDTQSIKSITDSDIDKFVECVHGFGTCYSERSVRSEEVIKCLDSETNSWQSDSAEGIDENINQSKEKTPKLSKRKYSGTAMSPPLILSDNKEPPIREYDLCDKETLKQHAIRLNPILHGNKIQEPEINIENSGSTSKEESSDSSMKNSPKRQKLNLLSPPRNPQSAPTTNNSNGTSKFAVQKKSPNQKNSNKKPQWEDVIKPSVQMPKPNSPAIKTAQKLKSLMGSDSSSDDDRPLSERLEQYRLKKIAASNKKRFEENEVRNENLKKESLPPPSPKKIKTRRQKKIIVEIEEAPPPTPSDLISDGADIPSTSTSLVNSLLDPPIEPLVILPPVKKSTKEWTRNEDKVILEAIDCGLTDEQELHAEISTYLIDRTYEEIVGRHKFLMDVLKQFQSNT